MSKLKLNVRHVEGGLLSLIGLIILIFAMRIPSNPNRLTADGSDIIRIVVEARFMPVLLSSLMVILGIRIAMAKTEKESYLHVGELPNIIMRQSRIIGTFTLVFSYYFMIGRLHFYLATFFFLSALMLFLQLKEIRSSKRLIVKILIIAFLSTLFAAVIFPMSLNLYLP